MTLVIMAAGMGSRYGGIKQIDPMSPGGEMLLDYAVYDAVKAGFDRIVFVIRQDIEQDFKCSIGDRFKGKITVDYVFQELNVLPEGFTMPEGREKPWGTGQAVLACKDAVNEPFIVINADDFYGAEAFIESHRGLKQLDAHKQEGFLIGYRLENTLSPHGHVTRGVCESQGGYLTKVTEHLAIWKNPTGAIEYKDGEQSRSLSGQALVSMNFWGFTPAIFGLLEECFKSFLRSQGTQMKSEYLLPLVVNECIITDRLSVRVLHSNAEWFGVTFQEDKPVVKDRLQKLIASGVYPSPLW